VYYFVCAQKKAERAHLRVVLSLSGKRETRPMTPSRCCLDDSRFQSKLSRRDQGRNANSNPAAPHCSPIRAGVILSPGTSLRVATYARTCVHTCICINTPTRARSSRSKTITYYLNPITANGASAWVTPREKPLVSFAPRGITESLPSSSFLKIHASEISLPARGCEWDTRGKYTRWLTISALC